MNRRTLADEIDKLDELSPGAQALVLRIEAANREIAKLQRQKSVLYKEHRAYLLAQGMHPHEASVEIALWRQNRGFEARRDRRKFRPADFQPARVASHAELRGAFRAGRPIGQDFTFQNALIYFAECSSTGRLKIGISSNVPNRLADLSQAGGVRLDLLGTLPGNRQEERRALEAFAPWRLKGEWHRLTDDCRARVSEYIAFEIAKRVAT